MPLCLTSASASMARIETAINVQLMPSLTTEGQAALQAHWHSWHSSALSLTALSLTEPAILPPCGGIEASLSSAGASTGPHRDSNLNQGAALSHAFSPTTEGQVLHSCAFSLTESSRQLVTKHLPTRFHLTLMLNGYKQQ